MRRKYKEYNRELKITEETMDELDDALYDEIQALSRSGDSHAANKDFAKALADYWKAYDLVPVPKTKWDASTWLLAAIGDANFLSGDYQAGVDNLSNAMHCPDAIGNPFLHLRLGQCQYELANFPKAADELTRAYALEEERIFESESPKYLNFLKSKINTEPPPKKPWWKF